MVNIEKKKFLDSAILSYAAYHDGDLAKVPALCGRIPAEFKLLRKDGDKPYESRCYAYAVYETETTVKLAFSFRGTKRNTQDILACKAVAESSTISNYLEKAIDFVITTITRERQVDREITSILLVGHSLGGYVAERILLECAPLRSLSCEVFSFDAPGHAEALSTSEPHPNHRIFSFVTEPNVVNCTGIKLSCANVHVVYINLDYFDRTEDNNDNGLERRIVTLGSITPVVISSSMGVASACSAAVFQRYILPVELIRQLIPLMAWGGVDEKMSAILRRLVSQTLLQISTEIIERLSINIIGTLKYHGMGRILFNIDQFMVLDPEEVINHIFKVDRWPSSRELMQDRVITAGNLRDYSEESNITWAVDAPRPPVRFSAAGAAQQQSASTAAASSHSEDEDEDRTRTQCSIM